MRSNSLSDCFSLVKAGCAVSAVSLMLVEALRTASSVSESSRGWISPSSWPILSVVAWDERSNGPSSRLERSMLSKRRSIFWELAYLVGRRVGRTQQWPQLPTGTLHVIQKTLNLLGVLLVQQSVEGFQQAVSVFLRSE